MKFQFKPNDQEIIKRLPATLFSYSYDKTSDQLLFTTINEGIVPFAHGARLQSQNIDFALLNHSQTLKLKSTIAHTVVGQHWSCSFVININNQQQWIEFSGRTEQLTHEGINGFGFAFLASEKIQELEQSREQLLSLNKLHDLIINFSTLLVQAQLEDVDQAVQITLSQLGEYAEVDRVYIFEYLPEEDIVNNTFEWCGKGISPEIDNLQGIPFSIVPRWKEKFFQNEYVYIPLVSQIAPEYHAEKEILEPQGIISLLVLPLYNGKKFFGFIGFDSVKRQREWSVEHINLLRLAGDIIAGTLNRARFEREIIAARKEAEEANLAKTEFLSTMSHEIRTPMNAILGFGEILHNSINDVVNKQYISAILSSGRTLLALINDILDLSKIESGQMNIMEEPVDVQLLVQEIVHQFQPKTSEKGIYLHYENSGVMPPAFITDEVRLRQILFNIVGNAVKFTSNGGVLIDLHAKQIDNTSLFDLTIRVHDTGIGIPNEKINKIFDPFFQVESTNTRKYGGTGLGLSIAQKLIRRMGGNIDVKSELGRGSTFSIHLPSLEATTVALIEKDYHDWETENVVFGESLMLIVDDIEYNRVLISKYFENDKIKIIEAENGLQGVQLCKQHMPDVVLMDLRMPVMNGYEAVEILKADTETAHIPVIAFTASSMKHDEEKIQKLFSGYIRKPVTRNEVVGTLKHYLPHSIQNTEIVSGHQSSPALQLDQISAFLNDFELSLTPYLSQLRTYIEPEVASMFARDLIFTIRQYGITSLIDHASKLQHSIDNFDFGQFEIGLNQLEKEINLFRSIINETT
jgi:signal transduction histidine kinase/DNA-binding response OmpR family regulator